MTTTAAQLVANAKDMVESVDVDMAAREIADGALLVDLREDAERRATGAIPGALHVPRGLLEFKADPAASTHVADLDKGRRTILYCAVGGRSALAAVSLRGLGYTDVAHLDGGFQAWLDAGRPTEHVD
ncbi:MAG TPA: rhodanese-like domain-containing protein [Ilumatobacteraceae bacterium]|nr:rhodanese-like domain-containing protein [Ilumatobacteraceae bacterium]